MALQYKLKVGGITNLTDARFFNALGANWLGFNLDVLNEKSISLKDVQAIKGWLFEPKIVIECGHHQDKAEIVYLANILEVEAVQVDIEHPVLLEDHFLYPIILSVDFNELQDNLFKKALKSKTNIEVIIIKMSDENFNWDVFKQNIKFKRKLIDPLKANYTVLIDLPFNSAWFLEMFELLQPDGIHINAEKEYKPGLSNVDVYGDLLELIERKD